MLQQTSSIQADQACSTFDNPSTPPGHTLFNNESPTTSRNKRMNTPRMITCSNPANPNQAKLFNRLMTFQTWKNPHLATPKQFAESGFYFLGEKDRVKCFNCNGGLQGWDAGEDPHYEHAKWFPECEFLQLTKGRDFVEKVKRSYPNLKRPKIHNPIPLTPLLSKSRYVKKSNADVAGSSRSMEDRLDVAMKSEVVTAALMFPFDPEMVRKLVARKLEEEDSEYTSVVMLVDDLQNEEDKNPMNCSAIRTSSPTSSVASAAIPMQAPIESDNVTLAPTTYLPAGLVLMTHFRTPSGNDDNNRTRHDEEEMEIEEGFSEEDTCKVCLDRRMNCIFNPCHHLCCCITCARALKTCPVCRTRIENIMKIYRK